MAQRFKLWEQIQFLQAPVEREIIKRIAAAFVILEEKIRLFVLLLYII